MTTISEKTTAAAAPAAALQPVQAAALAVLDLLDSLRERRVCLLAHAAGAAVAASLVAQRPGLVLCIALSGQDAALPSLALPAGLATRCFALAAPADPVVPVAAAQAQLGALLSFLGSARG